MIKSGKKSFYTVLLSCLCVLFLALSFNVKKSENNKANAWTQSDIKYFGYDLSVHQGNVDFNVMKNYADFVICRIGYSTSLDTKFTTFMNGAKAVGLPVGIYIYSLATSTTGAVNEANWVINTLASYGYDKGFLDFPVFFDYEEQSVISAKTKAQNTAIINAFVDRMAQAGYYSAMYVGGSNFRTYFDHSTLKCSAWIAHYGYTDQVSYFNNIYSGYNTCMWQFDGDGYDTASTKRGYEVGASSTNIDHNWCFVDFPKIIKEGGYNGFSSSNINKELADNTNWSSANNYDRCDDNFAQRSVTLTNAKADENPIGFINDNTSVFNLSATFKVDGKVSGELFGKIGIALLNGNNGMFFYANAKGTEGTSLDNITGTTFGVVFRKDGNWDWSTDKELTGVTFDKNKAFTFNVVRNNEKIDLFVNNVLAKSVKSTDFSCNATANCNAEIRSFQINATVTNYSCVPTIGDFITLDGNFEDWEKLPNYNTVLANKKLVYDKTNAQKGVDFYTEKTSKGLFVYAKAYHDKDVKNADNWWDNTNVEMFLGSDSNQYWANHKEFSGFSSAVFITKKSGNKFVTVFEGFIDKSFLPSYSVNLKYGIAFKVDNGTTKDEITPVGATTATSYWCAENSDPRKVAFTITNKIEKAYDVSESSVWKDSSNYEKIGNEIILNKTNTTLNIDVLHLTENNSVNQSVSVTFKLTGKYNSEEYAKVGLGFIDQYGDGFYFFADARGSQGVEISNFTGHTFGLVFRDSSGGFLFKDSKSIDPISNATYDNQKEFTMKIVRKNTVAELYVGSNKVYTIADTTAYKIQNGQIVYPSIISFNAYFKATNVEITPIDETNDLSIDGNFSDWQALSNFNEIDANKLTVTDSAGSGKQATFYTRLTNSGMYVYMSAKHIITTGTFLPSEWWKNTNFEMFVNGNDNSSQVYATALYNKGFTKCSFLTTLNGEFYQTVMEGFIDVDTLVSVYGYTGNNLKIGMAFKVDNLNGTADKITPVGSTAETSYWCANGDPRGLAITVNKLTTPVGPIEPDQPDSSSNSSSSSKPDSSSSSSVDSSSSSSKSESSSSSSKPDSSSSSSVDSSSSEHTSSKVDSSSSNHTSSKSESSSSSSSSEISSDSSSSDSSSIENESSSQTSINQSDNSLNSANASAKKGCSGSLNSSAFIIVLALLSVCVILKRKNQRK